MGKTKSEMIDNIPRHELDEIMYNQHIDDEIAYQQWLESDDYIQYVNEQLELTTPLYSQDDIRNALEWAKSAVNVEPTDIGKDVYDILFIEKVEEHLNKIRYDRF